MRAKLFMTLGVVGGLGILVSACGAAAKAPASSSSASSSSGVASKSTVTVGLQAPFTGVRADLGPGMVVGAKLAIDAINAAGGVLGHPLKLATQDDAGDPADAPPATETLINTDNAKVIIGPPALTASPTITIAQKSGVPVFMWGGGSEFDKDTNPYFFRMSPSDSEQGQAMALFAHNKGWNNIALAFGSSSASQSLVPPILEAAKALHMNVVANVQFTSGQSDYRSEIASLFSHHPQAILGQFVNATAGTVFGEITEEGLLGTPWIGSNLWYEQTWFQSVGASVATKVYLTNSTTSGQLGAATFLQLLQEQDHTQAPPNGSEFAYDGIMVWALGVDQAGTFSYPKLRTGILAAADPPGTQCGSYSTCYSLIKQGKKINWQGSASPDDFNKYDNVFGPFALIQFTASGGTNTLATLTAQQIETAVGG